MNLILKLFFRNRLYNSTMRFINNNLQSIESTIYRPSVLSNKGGSLEKADVAAVSIINCDGTYSTLA